MQWEHQIAVITGAYGGLGQELAKALAKRTVRLIITGRNPDKLARLADNLPSDTLQLAGDVCNDEFRQQLLVLLNSITQKSNSTGHLLINNAAISEAKFLNKQQPTSIQQMLNVNLTAPILLTQALLPWLTQAHSAKIINIGSAYGAIGYPGFSTYCAAKFGLRGFSQALGRELSDTNISVQYLAPRAIATDINSASVNQLNKNLNNSVDSVQQVVAQIIKAIEHNKTERFFGWPEKLFAKINAIMPAMVSASIKKDHATIKQYLNK